MPSQLHEALLLLFRNRPVLAAELLELAHGAALPEFTEARIEPTDLSRVQPAEYRADLVVVLHRDAPVLGIVVEAQLGADEDKRFSWPVYAVELRARKRCPVCVLVVTPYEHVARWARQPIDLGAGNRFALLVIGPSGVPVITDTALAQRDPELAVLSALAHGRDEDTGTALEVAFAAMHASASLDADRSILYYDLVLASLSEAGRKALQAMDPAKYEYQSEFARRYVAQGEAAGRAQGEAVGRAQGEAAALLKQMTLKFGLLPEATITRVKSAPITDLDRWLERVLSAASIDDVLT